MRLVRGIDDPLRLDGNGAIRCGERTPEIAVEQPVPRKVKQRRSSVRPRLARLLALGFLHRGGELRLQRNRLIEILRLESRLNRRFRLLVRRRLQRRNLPLEPGEIAASIPRYPAKASSWPP